LSRVVFDVAGKYFAFYADGHITRESFWQFWQGQRDLAIKMANSGRFL
jgi:hypothetical protein